MAHAGRPSTIKRSEYGRQLFEARKRTGLSQKEVAEDLGVTQQYVAAWERKGKVLRMELLTKLANLYSVSLDELIGQKFSEKKITPTGRLRRSLEKAAMLSRRQQDKIAEFVEAFVIAQEKK